MRKITVKEAAQILGMSEMFVRIGLQRGKLPIGTAIKLNGNRYTYYINPKQLAEYSGAELTKAEKIHMLRRKENAGKIHTLI